MYKISKSTHLLSLVLIAIGLISTVYAFITDSHAAWTSLIFNNYFFLGISIFAVFFVALQHVAEAGWSTVIKRVPEAIMTFLPYTCAVMIFIVIAAMLHWNHIYHWMEVGIMTEGAPNYDKIIAGKEAYLNPIFFLVRSIIYVVVWIYCAKRLRDISLQGDLEGGIGEKSYNKGITVSAWFIVFFAVSSSTASWDWIMSIDTHWFSTLFGWYIFSEWSAVGFTTILLFCLFLKKQGYLQDLNDSIIHDLGKWVFAFSVVWTYMWFSQFMLIWYANIPEEVTYFMERIELSNYRFLFWFSAAINFVVPTIVLMSRDAKRNTNFLIVASVVILIGHWINSYLLFAPGTLHDHGHLGLTELGMGLGFLGLFFFVVFRSLTTRPLSVKHHPFLEESKHLHT
ncbi:MAG: quinol:cytochrome C oxidoreductase [Pelagibacterales bacterium]|nr:quinol:cytochrome C oxidoreductase [Pelagibacterales bacterium]MBL6874744.1 quinol:cytochrome C oxidoreductase [Flavobacteriales bacterium]